MLEIAGILACSRPLAVMHLIAQWVFWASLGTIVYVFLGYPLTLALLPRRRVAARPGFQPRVTIVIAAYNEERSIGETVRNKLELDYAPELVEVLVVSDGSTDRTDEIVNAFKGLRLRCIRQEPRQGKTAALNLAVASAQGDIIVFSDANSVYARDALSRLVEPFADPAVGYATGKLIYGLDPDGKFGLGSSAYMSYENRIRSLETRASSVIGVNGGIDAVRKSVYRPMRADQLPDFVLPLQVVLQGYRVVFVPGAVAHEDALDSPGDELRMRTRVCLRTYWGLWDMRELLSPTRPLLTFQIVVHKVLRYAVFLFLLSILASNVCLAGEPSYQLFLGLQLVSYAVALAGPLLQRIRAPSAWLLPFHFLVINTAAAIAFVRFLRGQRQVLWVPRKGA